MTRHLENCNWQCTAEAQFGTDSEIHVWKIPLLPLLDDELFPVDILSVEEKKRLSKIKNASSRRVFISSRVVMRKLFSGYLGGSPDNIEIDVQPEGKPFLKNSPARLEFNLSHCGEQILLAIANQTAVGVDIEAIRPVKNWQQIARKVFSESQLEKLDSSPNSSIDFLPLWTEFEAHQKLVGSGVFGRQQQSLVSHETITFSADAGYIAALAFYAAPAYPNISFYDYALE